MSSTVINAVTKLAFISLHMNIFSLTLKQKMILRATTQHKHGVMTTSPKNGTTEISSNCSKKDFANTPMPVHTLAKRLKKADLPFSRSA